MLMESHVDPFNAQETQPYRNEPQIQAITGLVEAHQQDDIGKFERVLRSNKQAIKEDPFIWPYMEDLMTLLRTQVGYTYFHKSRHTDFLFTHTDILMMYRASLMWHFVLLCSFRVLKHSSWYIRRIVVS
jgi:hypothetical protein